MFQNGARRGRSILTSSSLKQIHKNYHNHEKKYCIVRNYFASSIINRDERPDQSAVNLLQKLVVKVESQSKLARLRLIRNENESSISSDQDVENSHDDESRYEIIVRIRETYLNMPKLSMIDNNSDNESDGTETRGDFIEYIACNFGLDEQAIHLAVKNYQNSINSENIEASESSLMDNKSQSHLFKICQRLRDACKPKYEDIFQLIEQVDRNLGMYFLVQLREDIRSKIHIMTNLRNSSHSENAGDQESFSNLQRLKQLDTDLGKMLSLWFSAGTLDLRRITYDQTPASIIEKIAKKEAVHPLRSLDDLRTRLGPDRRCFAFFHPSLPNEPLVFVHVALLSNKIPESMIDIGESHSTHKNGAANPTVATFYSITSTQPGLAGVDLGNVLIKRVVQALQSEYPSLKTFSTLSPIPRFRKWLQQKVRIPYDSKFSHDLFSPEERKTLQRILKSQHIENVPTDLYRLLDDNSWYENHEIALALKPILMRLAAYYLTVETHRGKILDSVARFHIKNGAEMYRLNYLADISRKGLHNSSGMMINYLYNLETIEKNQTSYELNGVAPVCEGVSKWLH